MNLPAKDLIKASLAIQSLPLTLILFLHDGVRQLKKGHSLDLPNIFKCINLKGPS